MKGAVILAALMTMVSGDRRDPDVQINTEGMAAFHVKQRRAKALEQPSKRKLKKMKGAN